MFTKLVNTEFNKLVKNYKANPRVPFKTSSALIKLEDLELFIKDIKQKKADCIRIYFLRPAKGDYLINVNDKIKLFTYGKNNKSQTADSIPIGCEFEPVEKYGGFVQGTVALVPAKKFQFTKQYVFSAQDIIDGKERTVLMPGIPANEKYQGTGLNPPGKTGK